MQPSLLLSVNFHPSSAFPLTCCPQSLVINTPTHQKESRSMNHSHMRFPDFFSNYYSCDLPFISRPPALCQNEQSKSMTITCISIHWKEAYKYHYVRWNKANTSSFEISYGGRSQTSTRAQGDQFAILTLYQTTFRFGIRSQDRQI